MASDCLERRRRRRNGVAREGAVDTRTQNGRIMRLAGGLLLAAGLALACTDTPTGTAPTYTVGGTVSGLAGSGLVLRDNDGDDLARSADGAFAFATELAGGAALQRHRVRPAVESGPAVHRDGGQRYDGRGQRHDRRDRLRDRHLHGRGNGLRPDGAGWCPRQRRRRSPRVGRRDVALRPRWPMAPRKGHGVHPATSPAQTVSSPAAAGHGPGQRHDRKDSLRDQYLYPRGKVSGLVGRGWCFVD